MKSTGLLTVAAVLLGSASSVRADLKTDAPVSVERSHFEFYETDYLRDRAKQSPTNWQKLTPIELLNLLKSEKERGRSAFPSYTVHYRWIRDADIHILVQQLDNEQKCSVITTVLDSGLPPSESTVAAEARHLIVGYWKGYYPVEATSEMIRVSNDEIRQWYRVWKKQFN